MNIKLYGEPKIIMSNSGSLHNYFGWPSAARLKNGKIAVGASGYRMFHICPFGKSVISFSEDDGESFTAPAPIIDTALDDRDAGLCPFGKNGLILTSFNNTVAFQREHNSTRPDGTVKTYINAYLDTVPKEKEAEALGYTYRISYDNGISFGKLFKSPITSPHGPIELCDGSILWVGRYRDDGNLIKAYKLDTPSGSMEYIGEIDTSGIVAQGRFPCEPYVIELEEGRLLCHIRVDCRTSPNCFTIYQTESRDGGRSWTVPEQILPDGGGAPSHILKHSSGTLVCVYGYRSPTYGIKVMFSRDGGAAWSSPSYIYENKLTGDLGYPSTVELSDGSLLTVFYAKHGAVPENIILGQRWSFEN